MGNNQSEENNQARANGQKIILKLRYRDIILHYSFKMKLIIADISIFPDHLEGLRLWDVDIILSRFIILENQRFKHQEIMVFKAGVGIAGITLSKWGGCKSITMCDTKPQVVSNMTRNCQRNEVHDAYAVLINLADFGNYQRTYDIVLCTDLFGQGFTPQAIINIWRKLLKVGGEAIMIVPDKKEESKKLLELIDRQEFKINNLILTAEEYQASPLFNKLQAESEFPLLGKSTFYAICLKKLSQIVGQAEPNQNKKERVEQQRRKIQQPEVEKRSVSKVEQPVVVEKQQQRKQNLVKSSPHKEEKVSQQPQIEQKTVQHTSAYQEQVQAVSKTEDQSIGQKLSQKQQLQQGSQQPAQPASKINTNQEPQEGQQYPAGQVLKNEIVQEEQSRQENSKQPEQS